MKTSNLLNITLICHIIYVSTYFIYKSRYPFFEFPLYIITTYTEIVFILIFLFYKKKLFNEDLFIFILIFILLIFHLFIIELYFFNSPDLLASIMKLFRLYFYFYFTYLFAKYILNVDLLLKYIMSFTIIFLIITVFLSAISSSWFMESGYGFYRPAAILSEPSAFAPIVSLALGYSLIKKNYFILILVLLSIFYINSGLVTLTSFVIAVTLLFRKFTRMKFLFTFFIVIGVSVLFVYYFEQIMLNFHSVAKIINVVLLFDIDSGELGQARILTFYNSLLWLSENNLLYIGTGFNSPLVVYGDNTEYAVFSFVHMLTQSFGLIALIIYLIVIFYVGYSIVRNYSIDILFIAYISFTLSAMLNSAEGGILWKFHLLIVFYVLFNKDFKYRKRKLN